MERYAFYCPVYNRKPKRLLKKISPPTKVSGDIYKLKF